MSEEPARASFRDPAGRLHDDGHRLLRVFQDTRAAEDLRAVLRTPAVREAIAAGHLVETWEVDAWSVARPDAPTPSAVFEHARIPFASYPYEWASEMLREAGGLTIDFALDVLDDGFGLKDATPYNVLFRGSAPVFIDLGSFERRTPGDPIWRPLGQFARTFLMPLLVERRFGVPTWQSLLVARDGLEPGAVYRMSSPVRRILPPDLWLVSLPTWLERQGAGGRLVTPRHPQRDSDRAQFVLRSLLRSTRRSLERLRPSPSCRSAWIDYAARAPISPESLTHKQALVERVLRDVAPRRVLDVGCNTGTYSLIAARLGAAVVAIDSDSCVVGSLWRRARAEAADILPLVVDFARPSPAIGWRNLECRSFLDRANGIFDVVLMLALVHHLLVTERIPLAEIFEQAAELTRDFLVIEYVAPDDPSFLDLLQGCPSGVPDLSQDTFESAAARSFELHHREHLGDSARWLYMFRRKR